MRAVVTGGAGFFGSHLVDALLEQGIEVVVLDNFSTGRLENLPFPHARLKLVEGSICSEDSLDKALSGGADVLYHLAANASVVRSIQNPEETLESNLKGSLATFLAAKRHRVEKVIFASSAAVYGVPEQIPLREGMAATPISPYGIEKLMGEHYLRYFSESAGFQGAAIRFFNIYGPRQDASSPYSGVISKFCGSAIAGEELRVFGDGSQTRDFLYVKDACSLLVKLAQEKWAGYWVANGGTGRETSLNQLTQAISRSANRDIYRTHHEARAGDIRHSVADVSFLASRFGWAAQTSLDEGICHLLASMSLPVASRA